MTVSFVLAAAISAPAWATCGTAFVLAASGGVCPMPADDHCAKSGARASADCCLLDARVPGGERAAGGRGGAGIEGGA